MFYSFLISVFYITLVLSFFFPFFFFLPGENSSLSLSTVTNLNSRRYSQQLQSSVYTVDILRRSQHSMSSPFVPKTNKEEVNTGQQSTNCKVIAQASAYSTQGFLLLFSRHYFLSLPVSRNENITFLNLIMTKSRQQTKFTVELRTFLFIETKERK